MIAVISVAKEVPSGELCEEIGTAFLFDEAFLFELEQNLSGSLRVGLDLCRQPGYGSSATLHEGPENSSPDLPVGAFKQRLLLIISAPQVRIGSVLSEHRAIIHERIIPLARIACIEGSFHER